MAYTRNDLHIDLGKMNDKLASHGYKDKMVAQGRNGHTGLDLEGGNGRILCVLGVGTPVECLATANQFYGGALEMIADIYKKKLELC